MNPEISIILPSIRSDKLSRVYESITNSTKRTFELIVIGPSPLPQELVGSPEIIYLSSFSAPIVASQAGAELARGKIFLWSADDAIFLPDALDKNIDLLYSKGNSEKNVVVAKYFEGIDGSQKPLQPDKYFTINGSSWTSSPHVSDDWWIFNVAIMYRSYFEELGGWDCGYQSCPLSHTNLAIRAYLDGASVSMSDYPLLDCDHSQPDHLPIETSMIYHDAPRYNSQFKASNINTPIKISFDNWKNEPIIWDKRFSR